MKIGIISMGTYLPSLYIKREEFQNAWGRCAAKFKQKTVKDFDEDTVTMLISAGKKTLANSGINPADIGVLCLASTSFPYAEKVISGTLNRALGLRPDIFNTEHSQSTRAVTEALLTAMFALKGGVAKYALVLTADALVADPGSDLDHGLGAGSAGLVLGTEDYIAEIEGYAHMTGDVMGERFRLRGKMQLRDLEVRSLMEKEYAKTVTHAVETVMEQVSKIASDYQHLVIYDPSGRSAQKTGAKKGFTAEQFKAGELFPLIGDTGCSAIFLSLAAILDNAQKNDNILLCSYGSGNGCDAVSIRTTDTIAAWTQTGVLDCIQSRKKYINYLTYLKLREVM